jgi:hypothetical protein
MGHLRTSAISYWRGVPKDFHAFGYFTQANYPIVQPQQIILNTLNNNKSQIRSNFSRFNDNYMNIQRLNARRYL